MVTKVQLDRLNSRIAALAVRKAPHRIAVIYVDVGESEEAAKERHYLACPKDREASQTIIVRYVDPRLAGRLEKRRRKVTCVAFRSVEFPPTTRAAENAP